MTSQHRTLAAGRWHTLSFLEQMGNIGSEVSRCIRAKNLNDLDNKRKALERALELFDLTSDDPKNRYRLREVLRSREAFIDFIEFDNQYRATDTLWNNYFLAFGYAARNRNTA